MANKPIWQRVADEEVRHIWTCDLDECSERGKKIYVGPSFYAGSGTPICDECGGDLVYEGIEVLVAKEQDRQ